MKVPDILIYATTLAFKKKSFKEGGIVPPPKHNDIASITPCGEAYFNKEQFTNLSKVMGRTDEEIEKLWEAMPKIDLDDV